MLLGGLMEFEYDPAWLGVPSDALLGLKPLEVA